MENKNFVVKNVEINIMEIKIIDELKEKEKSEEIWEMMLNEFRENGVKINNDGVIYLNWKKYFSKKKKFIQWLRNFLNQEVVKVRQNSFDGFCVDLYNSKHLNQIKELLSESKFKWTIYKNII